MNYRGLIGAGGLGAIALAVIEKTGQVPATMLGYILGGMGLVLVMLVVIDTRRHPPNPADPGASGPNPQVPASVRDPARKLIYIACSRARPSLIETAKNPGGEVFDSFASRPTRRVARDAIQKAKAVIVIVEAGERRDDALIELGVALPDKELYLLVARHQEQPPLSLIEPLRRRAAYLTFESDRDLEKQLSRYWGYVHAGNITT